MISSLRGTVIALDSGSVVVEVAGVGFRLITPERTAASVAVGEDIFLFTSLIVREDELSLCGFSLAQERDAFELLRSVSGVGPKSALGVLNELPVDAIASALASGDDEVFRRVSGIGPKTAKLIVLSLQGKLHPSAQPTSGRKAGDGGLSPANQTAIVQTLVGLGWSEKVARQALSEVQASLEAGETLDVTEAIKRALAQLGPHTQRESFS